MSFLELMTRLELVTSSLPRMCATTCATSASCFAWGRNFGGATQNRTGDKGVADLCLTAWLWRRILKDAKSGFASFVENGAEDEIRTRDVHLGKVTLYH